MSERISDQLIQTIRSRIDLVALVSEHLTLKKTGQNFTGLCPFHSEKTPSFVVNPAKQFFHCFGCSEGGDLFHFVSKMEQISFPEAIRKLAKKAGVTIPSSSSWKKEDRTDNESEAIYQLNEAAAKRFHDHLLHRKEAEPARAYLKARGLSDETIKIFSIGYALPYRDDFIKHLNAPLALLEKGCLLKKGDNGYYDTFRNRIIIPIQNLQGRVAGFGGRALDDTLPKYLNTSETPVFTKGKHLFGLNRAKGKKTLIMVEGYFDAISLCQAGVSNAVATLGTAVTQDHLHLIRRFAEKVLLIFDPDSAGVAAALRAAPLFIDNEISAEVITLPAGEDPDLFIRQQGQTAFLERLKQGESIIQFVITQSARSSSGSIEGRTKAIETILPLIRRLQSPVQQGHYLKRISEAFDIEERDVRAAFSKKGERDLLSSPSSAASRPMPLPPDEKTLAALLIQDQLEPAHLSGVVLDDFTHPGIHGIMNHFWAGENGWSRQEKIPADLSDSERKLFSELAVLDLSTETQGLLREDCLRSLQSKRLRKEAYKIQMALKSAEKNGDQAGVAALQHTFFSLKKELSQKVVSHSHG